MEIAFKNEQLRQLCNDDKALKKKWGQKRAKIVRKRLDQLKAAPSLEVMRNLPGRCHELKGDREKQLSIDLDGPYRLIFDSAEIPMPCKEDGGLDWRQVGKIRVLGVEDTHE